MAQRRNVRTKRTADTRFSSRRQPRTYRGAVNLRGSDNYASKLSEADVARCKAAFARGATVGELATRYDVHASTMSRALRGLTFGHVRGNGRKPAGARKR